MFMLFVILCAVVAWLVSAFIYKLIGGSINKVVNFYKTNLNNEKKENEKDEQI